jgi:hypothetical protein
MKRSTFYAIGLPIMLVAGSAFAQSEAPTKSSAPNVTLGELPQPAEKKTEAVTVADAFRTIWTGPNKAIFDASFLRRDLREEAAWKPDDTSAGLLEAAKKDIEQLLKLAAGPVADWQVRTKEEGFDAKVPHWAQLQTTGRVFFADARRLLARNSEGDAAAAAERILGIINLGRHYENDKLVGAVRTGRQVAVMGLVEAKRLADAGKLPAEMKTKLLAAATTLDNTDPLDMKGAITNEATIIIESTRRMCTGPDAASIFIKKFAPKAKPEDVAKSGVQNMDETTLHSQIGSVAPCYKEVVANWDAPNAIEVIKAIEQQRLGGDFGGPAVLLNSELQHHRATTFRMLAIVRESIKSLGGTPTTK